MSELQISSASQQTNTNTADNTNSTASANTVNTSVIPSRPTLIDQPPQATLTASSGPRTATVVHTNTSVPQTAHQPHGATEPQVVLNSLNISYFEKDKFGRLMQQLNMQPLTSVDLKAIVQKNS